tara:strand:+ start:667 stop:831 length:165 start_codon:yes stop_codon:yes gene_type:complete
VAAVVEEEIKDHDLEDQVVEVLLYQEAEQEQLTLAVAVEVPTQVVVQVALEDQE